MNLELLERSDPHVQEEWWKQRDLNGVLEKALQQAVAVIRSGELPEAAPALDADEVEWIDYLIGEGAKAFYTALQLHTGGEP